MKRLSLSPEERENAKPFDDIYPPEGAELVETEPLHIQTVSGRTYYWRTPDGRVWVDDDWVRHLKILRKVKKS